MRFNAEEEFVHSIAKQGARFLSTILAVSLAIASLANDFRVEPLRSPAGTGVKHQPATVTWRTDLRKELRSAPLGEIYGGPKEYEALPRTSLCFLDSSTIVVTFVTNEGTVSLKHRADSGANLKLRLRVILVDVTTGTIKKSFNLPSGSRATRIIAVYDGKILVQIDNKLVLYSSDFEPLNRYSLPELIQGGWKAYVSPSQRNVLLVPRQDHGAGTWYRFETDTLRLIDSRQELENEEIAISDGATAMVTCIWAHHCQPALKVRREGYGWVDIMSVGRNSRAQFAGEDVIYLSGEPVRILRIDGTELSSDEMKDGCYWGTAFASSGSGRLVVPSCQVQGRVQALDISGRSVLKTFVIYDAPWNGRSYTLDIKGAQVKGLADIAVSPDGRNLAVLNDLAIELIPLPIPR
jgi:hypothetical protein